MTEEVRDSDQATVSFLPSHSGDGYGWGGDMILTIGDQSVNLGHSERLGRQIEAAFRSRAELLASLGEIIDYSGGADTALSDQYVVERARAAVAKARGA